MNTYAEYLAQFVGKKLNFHIPSESAPYYQVELRKDGVGSTEITAVLEDAVVLRTHTTSIVIPLNILHFWHDS